MVPRRFVPLSKRNDPANAAKHLDVLHEGIPAHLRSSVVEFLRASLSEVTSDRYRRHLVQPGKSMLMTVERELEMSLSWAGTLESTLESLLESALADDQLGLDLIDHQLRYSRRPRDDDLLLKFMMALDEAGSAWTVQAVDPNDTASGYHLVRRVEETAQAAASEAMSHGKSGVHLRKAWSEAYGKKPDPGKAYSESVKAVEVAAGPIVTPNDKLATLGKMIGELKGHPGKFKVALTGGGDSGPAAQGDLDALAIARLMAQLLWTSQHDRHGVFEPSAPISVCQDEAEAAVHLAVLLVQWFESGVIAVR